MKRSWSILIAALLASVALVTGGYSISKHVCAEHLSRNADNLEWLRTEFKLNDAEMARIRTLHEGYLPKCGELCVKIAEKKAELQKALHGSNTLTPEADRALHELGELRAQCQAGMLKHFFEVSQAMPPEQGKRYLAEMERLTLGFHEQFEKSMEPTHVHGH